MVDFVRETVIDVDGVAEKFRVTTDTVYRWFKAGLESRKVGGKVYTTLEAIQRWSGQAAVSGAHSGDRAAIQGLKRHGIDMEALTDGRKEKARAQA